MLDFLFANPVPYSLVVYGLLVSTVTIGLLKYKFHAAIPTIVHRILAGLCLVAASIHGGYFIIKVGFSPLYILGLVPYVIVLANAVLALTRLNKKLKMKAHMWMGITAVVLATVHALRMLAFRLPFRT